MKKTVVTSLIQFLLCKDLILYLLTNSSYLLEHYLNWKATFESVAKELKVCLRRWTSLLNTLAKYHRLTQAPQTKLKPADECCKEKVTSLRPSSTKRKMYIWSVNFMKLHTRYWKIVVMVKTWSSKLLLWTTAKTWVEPTDQFKHYNTVMLSEELLSSGKNCSFICLNACPRCLQTVIEIWEGSNSQTLTPEVPISSDPVSWGCSKTKKFTRQETIRQDEWVPLSQTTLLNQELRTHIHRETVSLRKNFFSFTGHCNR